MPTRHLNYTGRKRIFEADAKIVLHSAPDEPPLFDASFDLTDYNFPADARVFVEAYRQTRWMRFAFGTTAELSIPVDRRLTEFDSPEAILFRVRITSGDGAAGLLLGEADRIRPRAADEEEEPKLSLLPVQKAKLGQRVWQLNLENGPILQINERLENWRDVVRRPGFIPLVCPAVFREILASILHVHKHFEIEPDGDWKSRWLALAVAQPGVSEIPEEDDHNEVDDWIEEVVASFCRHHKFLDRYMRLTASEESQ
jgi:hypothetical protein